MGQIGMMMECILELIWINIDQYFIYEKIIECEMCIIEIEYLVIFSFVVVMLTMLPELVCSRCTCIGPRRMLTGMWGFVV
jgi:hypothetical protein